MNADERRLIDTSGCQHEREVGFFVREQCECPDCHGAGAVCPYEDLYREFREHMKNRLASDGSATAENNWWAEKGYPGGPAHWPPEEETCSRCGGSGIVARQVPLAEALTTILNHQ